METEQHKLEEEKWKVENTDDIFPAGRYRSGKPSRKTLKKRSLIERKKLRKRGLLPEAKTGQSLTIKAKQAKKSDMSYHAEKRAKVRGKLLKNGKK